MEKIAIQEASCRVAFAAFMHDLGKLTQRAMLPVEKSTLDLHKQLYCPAKKNEKGTELYRFHVHAAYTAISIDILEKHAPDLIKKDMFPFASRSDDGNEAEITDSLINAASKHHVPDSYLQWVIATADRAASGFEREKFDEYNHQQERDNYKKARMLSLWEQVAKDKLSEETLYKRLPLVPLSPESMFPVDRKVSEPKDTGEAENQYLKLWEYFVEGLKKIPKSHCQTWSLWLDHLDSLWMMTAQAIPSATVKPIRPDVSLYDHSKTTAAMATAIWRYHHDENHDIVQVTKDLKFRTGCHGWDEEKLLLIQGDFFGIQDFIFSTGGETQKKATKLLRGRSFYVSLLTEIAALRILDELALPSTSMVNNAAGKFLIVAPNTQQTKDKVKQIEEELAEWFLTHTYGQQGIGIATLSACCNQFVDQSKNKANKMPFSLLIDELFSVLEVKKLQRYSLTNKSADEMVQSRFLSDFDNNLGACKITGYLPASSESANNYSLLATDQITIGEALTKKKRLIVSTQNLNKQSLKLAIFGYQVLFVENSEERGHFGEQIANQNIRRIFDFSTPKPGQPLWNGYAKRYLNGYVPVFEEQQHQWEAKKYGKWAEEVDFDSKYPLKTLNHIACENRQPENEHLENWLGISALSVLKGDVDNLGNIFHSELKHPTFAKMAAMSRQLNAFFTLYLPYLCETKFTNCYTVFAGGDDFFLIGPWKQQIELAIELRQAFSKFVCNDSITFSSGISVVKPGLPINKMAAMAEKALEIAKEYEHSNEKSDKKSKKIKDAVSVFGHTLSWPELKELTDLVAEIETTAKKVKGMSTGFVYGLIYLCEMAEKAKQGNVQANMWRAHLAYRVRRNLVDIEKRKNGESSHDFTERKQKLSDALMQKIGGEWIGRYGGKLAIALQIYFYLYRK